MRKKSSWKLAVIILTVIITSVIFFQWRSYSSGQNKEQSKKVDADFSIKHQNNQLTIQQTFHHLAPQTYEVAFPVKINNFKCTTGSGENCEWVNSNKSKLKMNSNTVTFTYKLNVEQNSNFLVLNNWFIHFKKLKMDKIKIQLSDSEFQNGTWISGGKNIAFKHLDFIDYYVFAGAGKVPTLIWTNHKLLKMRVNDWLTVYHDKSVNIPVFHFDKIYRLKNHQQISVYFTNDKPTRQFGSLIMLNRKDVSKLEPMIVQSYINNEFPDTEKWLRDIIASSILRKPLGSKKTQKMYGELAQALKDNELDKWMNEVINLKKEKIQANDLDFLLQKIIGLRTYFFQENNHETDHIQPIQFLDPHVVKIDGQPIKDLKIIFQNEKRLYPLEKTILALGYTINFSKNGSIIEVEKPNQQFQFIKNSHIFYYNNEKYGVLKDPIMELHHQYYMEENWLKQLFNVSIDIHDKEIVLSNVPN
ncbi:hypothetical protein AN964_15340 [Heyndrickxia shackletonii]|uniref:Copper amine oxidase-like N-terminal domain-containing protein n=1 Tax=Heyndrickxia shackletonii TaxID=157838 RepID=A0A0Q3WZ93_9BACI|nr:hypothetical protein [Heyndrickxia shackletonii]KQL54743.1 hypothetical protein AN964_15340 [Heyndrickxia shackletonii]NEY98398.1 hypothetical protein [Heyndrickxia shackletonii]